MLPRSAPAVSRERFRGMSTMRTAPGVLSGAFGGMSTMCDGIRPSYCCCADSLCSTNCYSAGDCGNAPKFGFSGDAWPGGVVAVNTA